MKDYYYLLGIDKDASFEEIKKAYRKLSVKFHPDKNDGDEYFEKRFKEINEAYQYFVKKFNTSSNTQYFPEIKTFKTDKYEYFINEPIKISWATVHSKNVEINLFGVCNLSGSKIIKILKPNQNLILTLKAVGGKNIVSESIMIKVVNEENKNHSTKHKDHKSKKKSIQNENVISFKSIALSSIAISIVIFLFFQSNVLESDGLEKISKDGFLNTPSELPSKQYGPVGDKSNITYQNAKKMENCRKNGELLKGKSYSEKYTSTIKKVVCDFSNPAKSFFTVILEDGTIINDVSEFKLAMMAIGVDKTGIGDTYYSNPKKLGLPPVDSEYIDVEEDYKNLISKKVGSKIYNPVVYLEHGKSPYEYCFNEINQCTGSCSKISVIASKEVGVIVLIKYKGKIFRSAYIDKGKAYEFNVPDGTYQPFFYFGTNWNNKKFIKEATCGSLFGGFMEEERFEKDSPQILRNTTLSYELIRQAKGNFNTKTSNRNETF